MLDLLFANLTVSESTFLIKYTPSTMFNLFVPSPGLYVIESPV